MFLVESADHAQRAIYGTARPISLLCMCFAYSKCKLLFRDWKKGTPNVILEGEELVIVDHSTYLGSRMSNAGSSAVDVNARITEAETACSRLKHL